MTKKKTSRKKTLADCIAGAVVVSGIAYAVFDSAVVNDTVRADVTDTSQVALAG